MSVLTVERASIPFFAGRGLAPKEPWLERGLARLLGTRGHQLKDQTSHADPVSVAAPNFHLLRGGKGTRKCVPAPPHLLLSAIPLHGPAVNSASCHLGVCLRGSPVRTSATWVTYQNIMAYQYDITSTADSML